LMEIDCHSLAAVPRTSKLFAAYLENFKKVKIFYGHAPSEAGVRAAAKEVRLDEQVRAAVVEVLREQNASVEGWDADKSVVKNLDRLAAGAVAVVTGQQVGLFTGPAYSVYKALTAIRWAEKLTRAGVQAVPVFWLATEDHDAAEVDHCWWSGLWGGLAGIEKLSVKVGEEHEGWMVGEIPLGPQIDAVVKKAGEALTGPGAAEVRTMLKDSYTAKDTFGSGFAKLAARIFKGRGLILLDPRDARLHRIVVPVMARAVKEHAELRAALVERGKELTKAGHHAQVKVGGGTTLVFVQEGKKREALRASGEKLKAGTKAYTVSELLARLEREPEAFTASALLRPVVQDALLPTAAYVAGPAEVAYYAQTEVLYRKLSGRMPAILPRASFTIIEPQVGRLLKKYGMKLEDVYEGRQAVGAKLAKGSLPSGLARRFAADEKSLKRALEKYRAGLKKLDKTLAGALDTAERKMVYQLGRLKMKAGRAEGMKKGVIERHERVLMDSLWPEKALQEREVCLVPMLARYGMGLLGELEKRAADGGKHCVVRV
jgi:bacillithiol synthase